MNDAKVAELREWYRAAVAAIANPEPHGFRITVGPDPTPSGRAHVELSADAAGFYLRAPRIIRDKGGTAATRDRKRAQTVAVGRWPVLDVAIAMMPDRRRASSRKALGEASWCRAAVFWHLVSAGMEQRPAARTVLAWDAEIDGPRATGAAVLAQRPRASLDAVEVQSLRDAENAVIDSAKDIRKALANNPTRP